MIDFRMFEWSRENAKEGQLCRGVVEGRTAVRSIVQLNNSSFVYFCLKLWSV